MIRETYDVSGMSCSACSARVEKAVGKILGAENVSVNLLTNSMQLSRPENISVEEIIATVEKSGYGAKLKSKKSPRQNISEEIREMKIRLGGSIAFLILQMTLGMSNPTLEILCAIPIAILNRKFFIAGFRNLFQLAPNMDSLIALGSTAAIIGRDFHAASMILTLITLGKFLESRAKGKTSEALKKLINLVPQKATLLIGGIEKQIPIDKVKIGDEIIVKPGERIPVDGKISFGETTIDESSITGESIPVEKSIGDSVTSATLNQSGAIRFIAQRVGEDTTIQKIIALVDKASSSKAPIARLADKIAGIFVPCVILIALIAFGIWLYLGESIEFASEIAISILVVSCPCALGLATPVAIMVGTGKGAENGILIKSGESLENSAQIDTIVLDKTGTITQGKPQVTDVISIGDSKKFMEIAASIESSSEHPLAKSVVEFANLKKFLPVENFKAIFGRGVECSIDNRKFIAGNEKFMIDRGIDLSRIRDDLEKISNDGKTPMIFARGKNLIGMIAVADVEKKSSIAALQNFRDMGIETVMLTGDNEKTARAIANRVGIENVRAGVLPSEKSAEIEKLQSNQKVVAMCGDGVNDAPALIRADVGLAIGAGSDIAIESADAVLIRNDLRDAVGAIELSRAVLKNIRQNLFWAFFYNLICIPIAAGIFYPAFGLKLTPMISAAAMSFSSVTVVLNALRLRFFKFHREKLTDNDSQHTIATIREIESIDENFEEDVSMKKTLKIEGMMCQHCQKHVHDALSKMNGVSSVEVSLEKNSAEVEMDHEISNEEFAQVIEDAGYQLVG
ncbi:MAG: heavy metal translocating P-type ATPase [Selenomonadaceae bacterium]|nr:heavy metal translocating P-type ATPase [Selenomonadaceae bacterium]